MDQTPETELIASLQSAAGDDIAAANKHWGEFVRMLFVEMQADGLPVEWNKTHESYERRHR